MKAPETGDLQVRTAAAMARLVALACFTTYTLARMREISHYIGYYVTRGDSLVTALRQALREDLEMTSWLFVFLVALIGLVHGQRLLWLAASCLLVYFSVSDLRVWIQVRVLHSQDIELAHLLRSISEIILAFGAGSSMAVLGLTNRATPLKPDVSLLLSLCASHWCSANGVSDRRAASGD